MRFGTAADAGESMMRGVLGAFAVASVVLTGGCGEYGSQSTTGDVGDLSSSSVETNAKKCLKYEKKFRENLEKIEKKRETEERKCFTTIVLEKECKSAVGRTIWGSFANKVKDECNFTSVGQLCDKINGKSPTASVVAKKFCKVCIETLAQKKKLGANKRQKMVWDFCEKSDRVEFF